MGSTMTFTMFEASEELDNGTYDWNFTYGYIFPNDFQCENNVVLQSFYAVVLPVLYTVIFLLGVAGNGLMITVLVTRWRQLRITEIYLLHLALADLMLLFTIPFDVADSATGWIFGNFMCKLNEVLKNLNLFCGSVLLACIGFDRYLAIVHAIPSMQSRLPRTVHLTCMILWLICFCLALPNAVFASVVEQNSTTEKTDVPSLVCYHYSYEKHANHWVLANNVFHHLCFFLSLVMMSYCYTALVITLCNSQKSEAKKGAIRISLLVTLVFCICWLPYNVSLIIYTMRQQGVIPDEDCKLRAIMLQVLEVTKSLGITHCCLNPFLYAFVGVRFRNEMIHLLCKLGCRRICLPFLRVHGHSRVSISDGVTTNSTVLM